MRYSLKTTLLVAALSVLAVMLFATAENVAPKRVVIKFAPDSKVEKVDSLTSTLGLARIRTINEIGAEVFQVESDYSVEEVVQICSRSPYVVYAEPTAEVRALRSEEVAEAPEPALQAPAEVAEYAEGEMLIKFKAEVGEQTINSLMQNVGIQIVQTFEPLGIRLGRIGGGKSVLKAVEECNADPNVEYAEPNYIYKAFVEPNDPRFSSLYGMRIIDAPEAWDRQTGSRDVIVGIIDTGMDHDHDDLKDNLWINPGEFGDGKENNNVDDDGNGFVDDYRGWDFINNDNDPFDDNQHGTHVAGTVGAVGNNGVGVVGVNWQVSLMPLKFLGRDGSGTTDNAVEAVIYATNMGAKVLSNSWGGGGRSRALEDAIKFANDNGVLFIAAAGNDFSDNDQNPTYPASYEVENVIAVAASTSGDNLAGFSNFGRRTVHLAAPGSSILSTLPRDRYGQLSGTSMATPHVSGAAALVWAAFPNLTAPQVKIRIMGSVDRNSAFIDRTISGGRLNVNRAISTNPVISTTRLENTLDETGPYVVSADIVDDGSIQNATLTYQVSGQSPVAVNMTAQGNDRFTGNIPGQPLGTTITYFVKATDNDGNTTQDSNFSFQIAEPENGGCGCGRPALDVAVGGTGVRTTVNAVANVAFFLLPVVALRFFSRKNRNRGKNG